MSTIAIDPMLSDGVGIAATRSAADPQVEVLALFAEHGPALFRFCRYTLGTDADAEDVVQDALLKLIQHLRAGGDQTNIRGWLFTVAANGCRDRLRALRRWLPWDPRRDDRAISPAQDDRRAAAVAAVLHALPARDRLIIGLRAQGLSYREIAAASGIREQSVGRLLARAVGRCRRAVEPQ